MSPSGVSSRCVKACAGAIRRRLNNIRSHQQIRGPGGGHSGGTARRAGPALPSGHVQRTGRIKAAVLQNPNVREDRCRGELHRHHVRTSGRRLDIFGIIDGLR